MTLDISKLKNVHYSSDKLIARCPACAENNHDRKGEHLCIYSNGKFSCVVNPGPSGIPHRKRIFELVGIQDKTIPSHSNKTIKVEKPDKNNYSKTISKNILGRLGQLFNTPKQKGLNQLSKNNPIDSQNSVPSIPKKERTSENLKYYSNLLDQPFQIQGNKVIFQDRVFYNSKEVELLKPISKSSFKFIHYTKKLFNGEIVSTHKMKGEQK